MEHETEKATVDEAISRRPWRHARRKRHAELERRRAQPRRRTVRLRLTLVYGGLFLVAGAIVLTISGLLWSRATDGNLAVTATVPARILQIVTPPPGSATRLPAGFTIAPSTPVQRLNAQRLRLLHGQLQVVARQQHNTDLRQLLLFSGIAFGGIALLTIALSWLTAGRVLRPLRTITSRTRELSASNLDERLRLSGPKDELQELGDTIDQLLERLDRSFQAQRQFVANASHELRTPLATMRASLEVALGKPEPIPEQTVLLATRLNAELDQVDRLLESFLTLAQAQRESNVDAGPFRLDLLVARALERHGNEIVRRSVRVIEDNSPDAWVQGDEVLLTRMVENLLDNALRHNESGGYLNISTIVTTKGALLVLENGGEVLDEAAVAALGQPFRRIGAERTGSEIGSGLGLSIVTAIVESHGGRMELQARPEGGLRVTVELPLATPQLAGAAR